MRFDYFCPMINQDCLGEKCAAFKKEEGSQFYYDRLTITIIKAKKPIDEGITYAIEDYHLVEKTKYIECRCHHYSPLLLNDEESTPINQNITIHRRRYITIPMTRFSYYPIKGAKTDETEIIL